MKYWVYLDGQVSAVPYTEEELKNLSGFTPDTLICTENTPQGQEPSWLMAKEVFPYMEDNEVEEVKMEEDPLDTTLDTSLESFKDPTIKEEQKIKTFTPENIQQNTPQALPQEDQSEMLKTKHGYMKPLGGKPHGDVQDLFAKMEQFNSEKTVMLDSFSPNEMSSYEQKILIAKMDYLTNQIEGIKKDIALLTDSYLSSMKRPQFIKSEDIPQEDIEYTPSPLPPSDATHLFQDKPTPISMPEDDDEKDVQELPLDNDFSKTPKPVVTGDELEREIEKEMMNNQNDPQEIEDLDALIGEETGDYMGVGGGLQDAIEKTIGGTLKSKTIKKEDIVARDLVSKETLDIDFSEKEEEKSDEKEEKKEDLEDTTKEAETESQEEKQTNEETVEDERNIENVEKEDDVPFVDTEEEKSDVKNVVENIESFDADDKEDSQVKEDVKEEEKLEEKQSDLSTIDQLDAKHQSSELPSEEKETEDQPKNKDLDVKDWVQDKISDTSDKKEKEEEKQVVFEDLLSTRRFKIKNIPPDDKQEDTQQEIIKEEAPRTETSNILNEKTGLHEVDINDADKLTVAKTTMVPSKNEHVEEYQQEQIKTSIEVAPVEEESIPTEKPQEIVEEEKQEKYDEDTHQEEHSENVEEIAADDSIQKEVPNLETIPQEQEEPQEEQEIKDREEDPALQTEVELSNNEATSAVLQEFADDKALAASKLKDVEKDIADIEESAPTEQFDVDKELAETKKIKEGEKVYPIDSILQGTQLDNNIAPYNTQLADDQFLKTFTSNIEEVFLDQPTSIISDYVPPSVSSDKSVERDAGYEDMIGPASDQPMQNNANIIDLKRGQQGASDVQQVRRIKPVAIKTVPIIPNQGEIAGVPLPNIDNAIAELGGPSPIVRYLKMFFLFVVLACIFFGFVAILASMNILPKKLSPLHGLFSDGEPVATATATQGATQENTQETSDMAPQTAPNETTTQSEEDSPIPYIINTVQNYTFVDGTTLQQRVNTAHAYAADQIEWEATPTEEPGIFSIAVKLPPNQEGQSFSYRFNYNTSDGSLTPTTSEAKSIMETKKK